jgi:uncharacterized protein with HEPN domain
MRKEFGNIARLKHIRDAVDEVLSYVEGISFDDFLSTSIIRAASLRQLSIIGEASSRITDELKESYPEVEWRKMIGMRNTIMHEYFSTNDEIIWSTIQEDLLILKN